VSRPSTRLLVALVGIGADVLCLRTATDQIPALLVGLTALVLYGAQAAAEIVRARRPRH